MGTTTSSAKATTTTELRTRISNRTDFNIINKNITSTTTNTTTTSAQSCAQSAITDQSLVIGNIVAGGSFTYDSTMDTTQVVDFSCLNVSDIHTLVKTDVTNAIKNAVKANMTDDLAQKLANAAKAAAKSKTTTSLLPSLHGTDAKTETDVKTIVDTNITNNTNIKISDIIETCVEVNISEKIFQSCVNSTIAKQKTKIGNITVKGDVTIVDNKTILQNVFAKCVNKSKISHNIIGDIANMTGVMADTDFKNLIKTIEKANADAKSDAEQKGLFGDLFKNLTGLTGILIGGCLLISCCIVVILIIFASIKIFGGGTHTSHVVMVPKDIELPSTGGGVLNYLKTQPNTYSPLSASFNMPSV